MKSSAHAWITLLCDPGDCMTRLKFGCWAPSFTTGVKRSIRDLRNTSAGCSRLRVNFGTGFCELRCFLFQANLQRLLFGDFLFRGEFADVLGDFHAASAVA